MERKSPFTLGATLPIVSMYYSMHSYSDVSPTKHCVVARFHPSCLCVLRDGVAAVGATATGCCSLAQVGLRLLTCIKTRLLNRLLRSCSGCNKPCLIGLLTGQQDTVIHVKLSHSRKSQVLYLWDFTVSAG